MRDRIGLVDARHPKLSARRQCELLGVSRSSVDYEPVGESAEDMRLKRLLDGICLIDPCLGSRRLPSVLLRDHGVSVNRKRLQRLRREMGHEAIWCRPRTSVPDASHRKYPYLLRNLAVARPNQVWCADIAYVPMPGGNCYLCAVMDWFSRKVLGWALSNTMGVELCLDALADALANAGGRLPDIFNTDQGSQFTSEEWTGRLEGLGVRVSMDGRGRWMDNVFIERLKEKREIRGDLFARARGHPHAARRTHPVDGAIQQLASTPGAWKSHASARPCGCRSKSRRGEGNAGKSGMKQFFAPKFSSSTPGSALHFAALRCVLRLPWRMRISQSAPELAIQDPLN